MRKRDDDGAAATRPGQRRYAPMSATLVKEVPRGDEWLFEVKWDGYRAISYVAGSEVEMRSRRGNDFTEKFERVAKEIPKALKTPDCVLDGEVCALDEAGRASFSEMQQLKPSTPLVYYVFDLLEVDGKPVVDLPVEERRSRLEKLLDRRNRTVRLSEFFDDGVALYGAAKEQGLEGIVAKRAGSAYAVGKRTRDWLKIKAKGDQELVIAGYTKGQGRRAGSFGSLVVGYWQGSELVYAGNVGTGFNDAEIDRLLKMLKPLERATPPFREVPKMPKVRRADVVWVEPTLVAPVEFVEWTHDKHLRAPVYLGLREDKTAEEVVLRGADADRAGDPEGETAAEAVQPGQALLAGGGDHQGRPARVLPRRRAHHRPAPPRPSVHDEALSRRLEGQVLLPEGRAQAHAGLDQDRGIPPATSRRVAREAD